MAPAQTPPMLRKDLRKRLQIMPCDYWATSASPPSRVRAPGCTDQNVYRRLALGRDSNFEAGNLGAEEGTRTPTPLRVHGPEPCASANSATSADRRLCCGPERRRTIGRNSTI